MAVKVKKHRGAWWVFVNHRGQRVARKIGSSREAADTASSKIQLALVGGDTPSIPTQPPRNRTPLPGRPVASKSLKWMVPPG